MARHLSVESVIDKNRITSSTVWLALLEVQIKDPNTREIVDTLFIANNEENVLFGPVGSEQVYQAGAFQLSIDQKQGETPTVSLAAQDQTRHIQSRMEAMAGGVFSDVILRVVNADRLEQPAEVEQPLLITTASTKDYVVTFQLGAENALGIQFPKHTQLQDRCAWRFKGYGCGYTGGLSTCDYTKDGANGCRAHFPFPALLPFRGLPGLVKMSI